MDHASPLLQAFVYLLAAVLSVPIAKRLGLGSVLGYLLAGALIGPFGLALVGEPGDVMQVAEFGVVMMLFLIGIELKPALIWRMRASLLGMGSAQVIATTATIAALALAFGFDWRVGLIVGMTLALSSTAIVLQSLDEKGLLPTPAGQSSFSVLLFQDIAVIPMLAAIPLLGVAGAGGGHEAGWQDQLGGFGRGLLVAGAVAAVILGGRLLTRPAFRFIAETRLRELFTASALLLVVATALLMEQVGLSAALGSFLAGVVLADSEFRHELEADIEPFKGLLLGLFFLSVGASVDFALLRDSPLMILALMLGLILVKLAVLLVVARGFGLRGGDGWLFALALAQGGEFAFVLFAFAVQNQALAPSMAAPLVAAVALSMATTPALLLIHERWLAPRLSAAVPARAPDPVTPRGRVIIAGFGRFGQIVGRLLIANGCDLTVLDHSADQIEVVRRFGYHVFYGDASRQDLLRAAGAADATLLVVAVDDPDKALEIVEVARRHFPTLKILARATDRRHAYQLMRHEVTFIARETFGSALDTGVAALTMLGMRAYQAERAGRLFRRHDQETLESLAALAGDDKSYGVAARSRAEDLARLIQDDRDDSALHDQAAWDTSALLDAADAAASPAPTPGTAAPG